MFKIIVDLNCSFFKSYRLCIISAKTNFFMFFQYIFTTKTQQATLAKVSFVFIFCFVKHKSVKIFDMQICDFFFHQLQATNPSSFQILDLKSGLEKLASFHNNTH